MAGRVDLILSKSHSEMEKIILTRIADMLAGDEMGIRAIAKKFFWATAVALVNLSVCMNCAFGGDLAELRERGVLRHIGVPYAHFVVGPDSGLSLELMQKFANHLGVRYEFVQSGWSEMFRDLTGKTFDADGDPIKGAGQFEVRGDVIASGVTMLEWRKRVVDFSDPTFPTQVWVISRADFPDDPIQPSGDIHRDITEAKTRLSGHSLLTKQNTCLDHSLYGIDPSKVDILPFSGSVNDIAPAIIKGVAELAFLDVPDCLVAFAKWPGKIKIIGPVSDKQLMAAAFRKTSPELRTEFNRFLRGLMQSGEYEAMIKKHYPAVFRFFGDFFSGHGKQQSN